MKERFTEQLRKQAPNLNPHHFSRNMMHFPYHLRCCMSMRCSAADLLP